MLHLTSRIALALALLAALVTAGGCAGDRIVEPHVVDHLVNNTWTLVEIRRGDSVLVPIAGDDEPYIAFEAGNGETPGTGRVTGFAGVNRYFGTVEVQRNGAVAFSDLGMTLMAGPSERMRIESAYIDALGAVTSCAIRESELLLFLPEGRLRFVIRATPAVEDDDA